MGRENLHGTTNYINVWHVGKVHDTYKIRVYNSVDLMPLDLNFEVFRVAQFDLITNEESFYGV